VAFSPASIAPFAMKSLLLLYVAESAVQYAERLLSSKNMLKPQAHSTAHKMVYEYKHHGFVIDREEASVTLGPFWVMGDTPETTFAEQVFEKFEVINILYDYVKDKQFVVSGNLAADVISRDKVDDSQ
jgi:hypothetical protein